MAAVCFYACTFSVANNKEGDNTAAYWQTKRLERYNDSVYPRAAVLVHSGDMITRLGTDITSEMLRHMNQTDRSFSHCGIASIEHDTIFVYHAIGGEFNPDQKLKRESLYSFCHPSANKALGIFNMQMDSSAAVRLMGIVQSIYAAGIPFDMKFDYTTDDRLYCAEFVAKSYSRALMDSSWFTFSKRKNFSYIAVDNLFLTSKMIEKTKLQY